MNILLAIHIACIPAAWATAIYFTSPTAILIALACNILLLLQWLILEYCILTEFETPGLHDSIMLTWVVDYTQTPIDDVKKAWTLINTAAPIFFELSRLATILQV